MAVARGVFSGYISPDTTTPCIRFNRDVSIRPNTCVGVNTISSGDVRVNQGCGYGLEALVNDINKPSLIEIFFASVPVSLTHFHRFQQEKNRMKKQANSFLISGMTRGIALIACLAIGGAAVQAVAGPVIVNGSFEAPVQSSDSYTYDPTGAGVGWTFSGYGGIAAEGSSLFSAAPPVGSQAAFLQVDGGNTGSMDQSVTGLTIGNSYDFSFFLAAMPGMAADPITVSFGGVNLGTFVSNSTAWTEFTTAAVVATSTAMTVQFSSSSQSGNLVSDIANVGIADPPQAPEPSTFLLFAPLAATILFIYRRRAKMTN